ncbi:hypothetical protein HHK36_023303 [Tetracentron sinense]|uniref:Glycolipid transfer protein domain-containing protein n=1 Tax=Tetracentron sinense TaxID=13715 RepID=A0A835D5A2_TETSI|nr:hypothetical protein HHK36_023303 [Tetracentron sinense]
MLPLVPRICMSTKTGSSKDWGNSLKDPASMAYAREFFPHHGRVIRKAVATGMYALPTKAQLLKKLNEDDGDPPAQRNKVQLLFCILVFDEWNLKLKKASELDSEEKLEGMDTRENIEEEIMKKEGTYDIQTWTELKQNAMALSLPTPIWVVTIGIRVIPIGVQIMGTYTWNELREDLRAANDDMRALKEEFSSFKTAVKTFLSSFTPQIEDVLTEV